MKILIIGDDARYEELRETLSEHDIERSDGDEEEDFKNYELIIDANFDDDASNIEIYAQLKSKTVIVSAVKQSLAEVSYLYEGKIKCTLIGANLLPSFINRKKWELSLLNNWQTDLAKELMANLNLDHDIIVDRVGMITPRVVCMIINEACYTLQEGTATVEDIDTAMKLGTNYPFGPFEWADRIGITDVFETLNAIYEDTHDERYKICPLLKKKYLRNESFYKLSKV